MDRTGYGRLAGLTLGIVLGLCFACDGRILYVDGMAGGANDGSSWANAYNYLQDALVAAMAADKPVEIRVAWGIYKRDLGAGVTPGDQAATFQLLNGVTLKGGYAGTAGPDPNARDAALYETILSGDLKGDDSSRLTTTKDNSCHLLMASSTDNSAVIDGFTITGGGAGWGKCSSEYEDEGDIVIYSGCPVIRDCRFATEVMCAVSARAASKPVLTGCIFHGPGMLSMNSSPVLTDCLFTQGGIASDASSDLSLTRCTFDQARISSHDSELILTDCSFKSHKSNVVEIWDGNGVLTGCLFERNGTADMVNHIIDFQGGALTLAVCRFVENNGLCVRGWERSRLELIRCSFTGNKAMGTAAVWALGDLVLHDCEFIGNSSQTSAGAVYANGDRLTATGSLFAGNSTEMPVFAAGAIVWSTRETQLSCCTFVGNRGQPSAITWMRGLSRLANCIIWNGPEPFTRLSWDQPKVSVTYSDIQGGYPGEGNIDVDPCFVNPGYWADPNDPGIQLGPDDPEAVWVNGDYHLKSQAGHWDRATETWVCDETTSLCIDAGDPNTPVGLEPFPNGGIVDLGTYGGTAEASKSYLGEPACEIEIPNNVRPRLHVTNWPGGEPLGWRPVSTRFPRRIVPRTCKVLTPQELSATAE
jgi:hypothetical protein